MTASLIVEVFDDMDEASYHQHPALSSSGVRALLRCPARYAYDRDHPRKPTRDMQLGTCVHTEVLGVGRSFDVLPDGDRRTKAVKEAEAEFEANGLIALTQDEYAALRGMADAIFAHPLAGPLLGTDRGVAERSLFWTDAATGVQCRARIDFSPHNRRSIVDLKTTADANPASLGRHMARYGYPIQAAHYLRAARAAGLADEATEFVWVFVEREPPHFVTVCRLAPVDTAWANERLQLAYEIFRDCTDADRWPGYPEDLITVAVPTYARREYEEDL